MDFQTAFGQRKKVLQYALAEETAMLEARSCSAKGPEWFVLE
jgi:hypothetical protein